MALTQEQKDEKAAAAAKAKAEKALATAAEKQAKADQKAKDKAEKEAAKPVKAETIKQNGIPRPNKGKTLRVWEIADEISKALKGPADRKAVTEKGVAEGLEAGTIHTQYGRWRKFHGLTGQRVVNAEVKAEVKAAPADPEAKAPKLKSVPKVPKAK